ncbi:MAG: ATP synthase F0 subunit C [Proteobacteria bacterium]|nr:ATP synthase F0 subunit C [Pseudomonadota bacterium]
MLKAIGAGLAALGMIGSAIGLGMVFGKFFEAVGRQPAVEEKLKTYLFIGMALVEAIALFAFVIAVMILFVL